MNKAQSNILAVVLMSGIAIVIVSAVLVWGKPLIDKSSDKISMQNIINTLQNVDEKIVYVASNTGSQRLRVDVSGLSEIYLDEADNSIVFRSITRMPLVGSVEWVPLNTYELPDEKETLTINTTSTACTCGSTCGLDYSGLCSSCTGEIKHGTATINTTATSVHVCTTNGVEYNRICFNTTQGVIPTLNCYGENGLWLQDSVNYRIIYVDRTSGNEAVLEGAEVENIGIQGRDVPGIIAGRLTPAQDLYEVRLRLKYRGLEDENGMINRIRLSCGVNCFYSSSKTTFMKLTYNSTRTMDTISETYIKVEFE
ncbi:MAG: hypothetical protein PHW96_03605 [Candidatus Nanoarchaeia archaeon]|nr:hypothetical protein [Candidatus Nanoarchaeia archaeon]